MAKYHLAICSDCGVQDARYEGDGCPCGGMFECVADSKGADLLCDDCITHLGGYEDGE
jgi:hypothetical protein